MNRPFRILFHALTLSVIASAARAEVTAALAKGKLKITSDSDSHFVTVIGDGELGRVTVNSNFVSVGEFTGVRDIDVKMGAGDDQVGFYGIQIGGKLRAKLGDGDDELRIGSLNNPVILPVFIGRDLDVTLGGDAGDEALVLPVGNSPVHIFGNVTIRGASSFAIDGVGSAPSIEAGDIVIGGKLRIERAGGDPNDPQVAASKFDDVNVGGDVKLVFGNERDELRITESHFARKVTIRLRGGDDVVDLVNDATKFDGPVEFIGGSGIDSLVNTAGCEFAVAFAFPQMEFVP